MTAIATRERPPAATRISDVVDRALPLLPLLAAYLLLTAYFGWHAAGHDSPWLFTDEIEHTQISRSIAETGEGARRGVPREFLSVSSYLTAPIWRLVDDTEEAYELVKYLGVFVMAMVIFPAYALARLLVPRPHALFVAVASGAIPAMAYSRLLISEPYAYPYAALTFFLLVKGLATKRWPWLAAAVAASLAAALVRNQFELFGPILLGSVLTAFWLSDPVRRFRARLGWGQWPLWAAVAILALGTLHEAAKPRIEVYYIATTLLDRLHEFGVWAAGAFVIGIGVVPAIIGLAAMWRPRDLVLPEYRAFVSVFATSVALFGLYTAAKAVYISTIFSFTVYERNLIYLSPLFFVATALWLHRPTVNLLVLGAATAGVAYLVVNAHYELAFFPYGDAPGLAVLAEGNRSLSLDEAAIQRILVWICGGTLVGAGLLALAPERRRLVGGFAGVVAVLVVAWELVGANAFGNGVNRLAGRIRSSVPQPPTWVDRATGGEPTAYVGQGIADPNAVLATEFWNRSIQFVGSLDGTAPGPGPSPTLVPTDADGSVANDPELRYLVTDSATIDVYGRLVEQTGLWRLLDVGGKIRLRSSWTGVYPDGWIGAEAAYSFFGEPREGFVEVLTSRAGWNGPDRPGEVRVRVGTLEPAPFELIANPCFEGRCTSTQPRIGRVTATRTWTAHSGKQQLFRIPVTTPFRVEIRVDPTFSPYEFGVGDNRQLGVQVAAAFKPAR
jgi:hypothetical protein